jgi:hypothetical protein
MTEHIHHDQDKHQFGITVDGHTGIATYLEREGVWIMDHTYVPDALRGQGVAAQLVEAAFTAARKAGVWSLAFY